MHDLDARAACASHAAQLIAAAVLHGRAQLARIARCSRSEAGRAPSQQHERNRAFADALLVPRRRRDSTSSTSIPSHRHRQIPRERAARGPHRADHRRPRDAVPRAGRGQPPRRGGSARSRSTVSIACADRVTEVEHLAQPAVALVLRDDPQLRERAASDHLAVGRLGATAAPAPTARRRRSAPS